ncbi:MAG: transcriptional regulator [Mycobacterium sp.]|nr:transcriptional regulator [Mycobacterium sp.]MCW2745436.1 transcriptional regulator [Mycobacterium sp.]
MTIRTWICASDRLSCAGLGALLEGQDDLQVVGTSVAVEEAVRGIRRTGATVVIATLAREVRSYRALAAAAKLVTFADAADLVCPAEVLQLNARAVLPAGGSPGELMHAIRLVDAGDALLLPRAVSEHVASVLRTTAEARDAATLSVLTAREAEVLTLLAQGWCTDDVAADLVLSRATVRSHVHHILQKLEVRSRSQAVALACKAGILMPHHDAGRSPGPTLHAQRVTSPTGSAARR